MGYIYFIHNHDYNLKFSIIISFKSTNFSLCYARC